MGKRREERRGKMSLKTEPWKRLSLGAFQHLEAGI